MEFKRERQSNVPFGLHDSRIMKIRFEEQLLILEVDRLFEYTEEKEMIYTGEIEFTEMDVDNCSVLVFDRTVYEGEFSGKAMPLKEYATEYANAEFEILTEGYHGYCTTYLGWIWQEGKEPVSGIMNLWNMGEIIYKVEQLS